MHNFLVNWLLTREALAASSTVDQKREKHYYVLQFQFWSNSGLHIIFQCQNILVQKGFSTYSFKLYLFACW